MEISSIMVQTIRTVKPSDSAGKAVELMTKHRIGSVVVADDNEALGIITEQDILRKIVALERSAEKVLCKEIMSRPLITIEQSADISEAIELMSKNNIKKLPVTKDGKLVGIVTVTDLIKSNVPIEEEDLDKLARIFPVYRPVIYGG